MNSHYDPLFAPFDDDAGNFSEYYPDMTKEDFVRMVCNLRRAAATGAFASGHSAEHNGHPY